MLQYLESDLIVEEAKMHYYRTGGNKRPIVLLHGATDNGLCWSPVAEWLSARYDVIMPDAPGHGLSDRLTPGSQKNRYAAQVAALIQQLKLSRPLVMGHSMGAGAAVDLAVNYADLVKAVILEDPGWRELPNTPETPEAIRLRAEMLKALTGFSGKSETEVLAEGRRLNPRWSEAELIPWAKAKTQFDSNLFKNVPVEGPSYKDLVPAMNCPALLIIAENGIVTAEVARQAARLWKSPYPFKWTLILGAGHNIRREQFSLFKEAVDEFIGSL
jgi:N-formylmaleamate deformylase